MLRFLLPTLLHAISSRCEGAVYSDPSLLDSTVSQGMVRVVAVQLFLALPQRTSAPLPTCELVNTIRHFISRSIIDRLAYGALMHLLVELSRRKATAFFSRGGFLMCCSRCQPAWLSLRRVLL